MRVALLLLLFCEAFVHGLVVWDDAARGARRQPWPTPIVVVVAAFNEYDPTSPPQWMHDERQLTFYVYQRVNATAPNYSPNFGQDGGMIVQFVRDHYVNLPQYTAILQAVMEDEQNGYRLAT